MVGPISFTSTGAGGCGCLCCCICEYCRGMLETKISSNIFAGVAVMYIVCSPFELMEQPERENAGSVDEDIIASVQPPAGVVGLAHSL